MKNYKYIGLMLLSLGFASCDVNNELDAIPEEVIPEVALNTNGLDFSSYVSIGASFTAGYTDGAMFVAAQENSFPNILASKFGTTFNQPLMSDLLFFQTKLFIKQKKFDNAIMSLEKIIAADNQGFLTDDVYFIMAELYHYHLNNSEKAKEYYQKIIFEQSSSIFLVEARKRFRKLRGDNI